MKYIAYFQYRRTCYKGQEFVLNIIGIGEVTSETISSYGAISWEIRGRGLEGDLESLIKMDGWRRGSTVIDKEEHIRELTEQEYKNLLAEIR